MTIVYVGIGSNLEQTYQKEKNLSIALTLIARRAGKVARVSGIFKSEPWRFVSKHKFANIVAEVETELSPDALLAAFKQMEADMGRAPKTSDGYEDRVIDIDILFYGQEIIHTDTLDIPHKTIEEREFVLAPMCEIAPDFRHPELGKSISRLLRELRAAEQNDRESEN